MRKLCLIIISLLVLVSCSTPKYTYYFDWADHVGTKNKTNEGILIEDKWNRDAFTNFDLLTEENFLKIDPSTFSVSTEKTSVLATAREEVVIEYKNRPKAEQKVFRKEIKQQIKSYYKATRSRDKHSIEETTAMDSDLKLAAIFGAAGLVFLLITSNVFLVMGAISLIIGLVFFIRWLSKQ